MFAKLFGTDKDQILVKLDTNDDGNPEIRFYFEPEGLGVCSIASSWKDDSDKSWDKAEAAFALIDEEKARNVVSEMILKSFKSIKSIEDTP